MPTTKVSSSITSQIFKGSLISAKFGERCFRAEIPLDEEVKAETPTVVLCVPGEELSEGFVFRITETVPEVVTLEWLSGVLTTVLGAYAKEQGWGKSAKWNIHWQSVAWCGRYSDSSSLTFAVSCFNIGVGTQWLYGAAVRNDNTNEAVASAKGLALLSEATSSAWAKQIAMRLICKEEEDSAGEKRNAKRHNDHDASL